MPLGDFGFNFENNGISLPICQFGVASQQEQLCSGFVDAMCQNPLSFSCAGAVGIVLLADLVDFIVGQFAGRPTMAATVQIAGYAKDKNPILRTLGWGAVMLGRKSIPISSSSGEAGSFGPYFSAAVYLYLSYNRNASAANGALLLKSALHEMGNKAGGTLSDLRAIVKNPITIAKGTPKRNFTLLQNSRISQVLAYTCQSFSGPNSVVGVTCPTPPSVPAGGGGGGGGQGAQCGSGLTFDPASQSCTASPVAGACPAGFTYNPASNSCTPNAYVQAGAGDGGGGGAYTPDSGGGASGAGTTDGAGAGAAVPLSSPLALAPASPYSPMSFSVGPDTVSYSPLTFGGPGPTIVGPDIGGDSYVWGDSGGGTSFGPERASYWSMPAPAAQAMNWPPSARVIASDAGTLFSKYPELGQLMPLLKKAGIAEAIDGIYALAQGRPLTPLQFGAIAGGIVGAIAGSGLVATAALGVAAGGLVALLDKIAQVEFGRSLDDLIGAPLKSVLKQVRQAYQGGGAQPGQSSATMPAQQAPSAASGAQQDSGGYHQPTLAQPNGATPSQGAPQMGVPLQKIHFADEPFSDLGEPVNGMCPPTRKHPLGYPKDPTCPDGPCACEYDVPIRSGQPQLQRPAQPPASGPSCTPCEEIKKALQSCTDCGDQSPLQVGTTSINPSTGQPEFHPLKGVDPITHQPTQLTVKPVQPTPPITVCFTCESDDDLARALSGQANTCQLTSTSGGSASAAAAAMYGAG